MKKNSRQKLFICALILLTAGTTASADSEDKCKQISGLVRLDLDVGCNIIKYYPGNPYLGAMGSCFKTTAVGTLSGKGYSGLTTEMTRSPLTGGSTPAPLTINEQGVNGAPNEFQQIETRRFFTARSILQLKGGDLYTADAGVMGSETSATEQLVITHGTGRYKGMKGTLYLTGKAIQNWAPYNGQICRP